MNKLNLGITFPANKEVHQILHVNGIVQNCKFFFDLLQLLGHDPCFVTTRPVPGQIITIGNKNYRALSYQEIDEQKIKLDIAFDPGVAILPHETDALRRHANTKVVALRYGHSMLIDMEQIFIKGPLQENNSTAGRQHVNQADFVWTSPHLKDGASYLATIYDCPTRICPFIWEPDFVSRCFGETEYLHKPDIYVMEPNLNVLKNSLIPLSIIEQVYRAEPDAFGKATVLNCRRIQNQPYFLENVVRNMSSLISGANKVYFTGRYTFDQVFKRPDILIGHQWGCELNYLYFEALSRGVPLVHNSEAMQEVGYYYPRFDTFIGRDQCMEAIKSFDSSPSRQKDHNAFLARYSIQNPEVKAGYRELIDEVME